MKKQKLSPRQRTALVPLVTSVALLIALAVFLYVASKNTVSPTLNSSGHKSDTQISSDDNNSNTEEKAPSATKDQQNTKLLIKEWGVAAMLPAGMQEKVTYVLGEISTDPDGNQLQAAKIFVKPDALPNQECTTTNTSLGPSVDVATQYIRSETSKPFSAERYRWTFIENVVTTTQYNYHLNYLTPDCLGASVSKLEALQKALANLQKVE